MRVFSTEDQRYECRARFADGDIELAGDVIAESGRAHLRDRETAGGDDERFRPQSVRPGFEEESVIVAVNLPDLCVDHDADVRLRALLQQHRDNLLRAVVAKKLPQRLLVIP